MSNEKDGSYDPAGNPKKQSYFWIHLAPAQED
jgi:hypothetical protein